MLRGGHNIPDEDIIRRHERSMKNLKKALEYSNRIKIYDNTFNKHQLLFELEGLSVKSIENVKMPQWVYEIINLVSLKLGGKLELL